MKIHTRIKNDVAFVTPYGKLIGGIELEKLDKIFTKLNNNGIEEYVVDFTNISIVNSSGAGFLVTKKNSFRQFGKGFRIVNINNTVRNYLEIAKLTGYLQ